jgi:hypothetical protein
MEIKKGASDDDHFTKTNNLVISPTKKNTANCVAQPWLYEYGMVLWSLLVDVLCGCACVVTVPTSGSST